MLLCDSPRATLGPRGLGSRDVPRFQVTPPSHRSVQGDPDEIPGKDLPDGAAHSGS